METIKNNFFVRYSYECKLGNFTSETTTWDLIKLEKEINKEAIKKEILKLHAGSISITDVLAFNSL